MWRRFVPLAMFAALVLLLAGGLTLDPKIIPSPLLEAPAPQFSLSQVHDPKAAISVSDLRGQVVLLNVWASWCVSCRLEHELLVELSRSGKVAVYGLNYKDRREDALKWLQYYGDPYRASAFDGDGRVAIDYGVYGVPETFVIDREGVIRYKHVGPIDRKTLDGSILPLVRRLQEKAA